MNRRLTLCALMALCCLLLSDPAAAQNSGTLVQPFSGPVTSPDGALPGFGSPSALTPVQPPQIAPSAPILTPLAIETPPAPVVVELFTSGGCSSCPTANDYQRELAQRRDLLPLSFHVDYWDYIGWTDRFGDPAFAARQRAYAAARGKTMIYTPQMVIAGAIEVVGSVRKQVEKALKAADRRHAMYALSLAKGPGGDIHLALPRADLSVPASLWLVTYVYEDATDITGGENRGQHMITTNVVRSLRKIGLWDGTPDDRIIRLNDAEIAAKPDACAIIANEAEFGPVVAAAAWDFKDLW